MMYRYDYDNCRSLTNDDLKQQYEQGIRDTISEIKSILGNSFIIDGPALIKVLEERLLNVY